VIRRRSGEKRGRRLSAARPARASCRRPRSGSQYRRAVIQSFTTGGAALAASALLGTASAGAAIYPAHTIDGPGPDVLELGDVALAPDGTGGLVYLRIDGGRPHVYASRFDGRRWHPPRRIDRDQRFAASWPRIAAGEGGRLLVVWVQEHGPGSDRLHSAALDPGASNFERAVAVDMNVGEASATHPSLAMTPGGQAVVVYRVVTEETAGVDGLRPGRNRAEFRAARWRGLSWSGAGVVNRSSAADLPPPAVENSPRVVLEQGGQGAVAWIEPDDELVDRVWARRIFPSSVGFPLLASPREWAGRPLRAPADAFSLGAGNFGVAAVAFRQHGEPGGPLERARVLVNALPSSSTQGARDFAGPMPADGSGVSGTPGTPAVAITEDGDLRVAFPLADRMLLAAGNDSSINPPEPIDHPGARTVGPAEASVGPLGETAAAWISGVGDAAGVSLFEESWDGVRRTGLVAAPAGGPIGGVALAGSGLGDALVAFRQGGANSGQIAVALIDAAPGEFGVDTPVDAVRPARARFGWERPPDAIGGLTYTVFLDGVSRARGVTSRRFRVDRRGLEDGVYRVEVVARDASGQDRISRQGELVVDGTPPSVSVRVLRGRRVRVRISDGRRGRSAGVDRARTSIAFGDGIRANGRSSALRRYARPGTYRIVVRARDLAGNRITQAARVRLWR